MKPPNQKADTGLTGIYSELFGPWRDRPVRVLEIGIWLGGSLWFWTELFPHPQTLVVGIDVQIPPAEFPANVKVHLCNQNDDLGLQQIAATYGPFDLIVDDGSHFANETRNCFATLFPSVKVGGSYVIEDWGVGYWRDRDARHRGMVEAVTDIVQQAPAVSIDALLVSLKPGQSYVAFRKGAQGWKG